ncbi:MAG: hypothetical protein IPO30_13870 [Hyphomonadaceae bacterium]|nr:hypothetical protein [Hyphomonadaceae bacterium]MBP9235938.1 hypothetical protein [Hyphomonadaceae bacterium]
MPHPFGTPRPRWLAPGLFGLAGAALVWTMWLSGGDFWRMQRPFMAVTLISAATLVAAATIAAALPRGRWRSLMIAPVVVAILATFLGEGLAERLRFDELRASLAMEVETIHQGGDCTTPCRIDSREPLRIAFQFSGEGKHWSGVCYDATDIIYGVEFGGSVRPPNESEAVMLAEARTMFSGEVRHAPSWGEHWYGCSTRP